MQSLRKWGTPLTLLILLAILGFGARWGWKNLTKPFGAGTKPCVSQSASVLKTDAVSVRVFNAGSKTGQAAAVAAQLKAKGFKVRGTSNTNNVVTATTITGSKPDDPEMKLVLGFFPGAVAVGDDRNDHVVDVTIADGFAGFKADAPMEIAVPGGTVCLPAQSTAPASPSGSASKSA